MKEEHTSPGVNKPHDITTDVELGDDNRTALGETKSFRKTPYNSRYMSQDNVDGPDPFSNEDAHKIGLHDLFVRLLTDPANGLTNIQVRAHEELYGLNEIRENLEVPEWVRVSKHMFGGCSFILWFGALLCFTNYSIHCGQMENPPADDAYLGTCLLFVILGTGLFSYYQEYREACFVKQYQNLVPKMAKVLRNGVEEEILAEEIVLGDVIFVRGGDFVPADARVLECSGNFMVDNSAITGESEPQERDIQFSHDNILLTKNMIFCSTFAVQGYCKGVVTHTGVSSALGQMADQADANTKKTSLLTKELSNFVVFLTGLATICGIGGLILAFLMGYFWVDAILFMIGVIVSIIPEGLLAIVTISLSVVAKRLVAQNCAIKSLDSLETIVAHVWLDNDIGEIDTAVDYRPNISFEKSSLAWKDMARAVSLCSRAEFTSKSTPENPDIIGSPVDVAVVKCAESIEGNVRKLRIKHPKVAEIPFNNIIKFQLSIHEIEDYESRGGVVQNINEKMKEAFYYYLSELGGLGEKVVAVADYFLPPQQYPFGQYEFTTRGKVNFPLKGFRLLGMMSMMDPPRPSVPDSISKCQAAGIKVIMVTGDNGFTARAIAKSVGILGYDENPDVNTALMSYEQELSCLVSGDELDTMTDEEIESHKVALVEACQRLGAVVAVTGDGVNDAPALRKADVAIAMGYSGSDIAKECADIILLDDNFSSIVIAIEEGRIIYDNIKKACFYSLTSNIPQLGAFILFIIAQIPLPLGALGILVIDLGTDILPAISLAYEEEEVRMMAMKRGPRHPIHDDLLDEKLLFLSGGQMGLLQAAAGFFTYFVIMAENGFWPSTLLGIRKYWDSRAINDLSDAWLQDWTYEERKQLQYSCQAGFVFTIVLCQWITLIAARTQKLSIFQYGMGNWTLNFSIIFETILIIVIIYIPGLNNGLQFRGENPVSWFSAIPFMLCLFGYDEIRKAYIRRHRDSWIEEETAF
ncbi:ATP1A [Lepeophtheirus salmonis]|uniref:ATP1A n=1 Tax=Lepeophtheirus salmonis TaxID=72036 RepID=A0A7R8CRU0_LEPSM|nr:ATP1A [Lepeophtheirus salmonis]CAF2910501.1 ATP1A [Lepeophtheirus salmonis]